jgi:hypothetical protein
MTSSRLRSKSAIENFGQNCQVDRRAVHKIAYSSKPGCRNGPGYAPNCAKSFHIDKLSRKSHPFEPDVGAPRLVSKAFASQAHE